MTKMTECLEKSKGHSKDIMNNIEKVLLDSGVEYSKCEDGNVIIMDNNFDIDFIVEKMNIDKKIFEVLVLSVEHDNKIHMMRKRK